MNGFDVDIGVIGAVGGLSLGALFIMFLMLAVTLDYRRKVDKTRQEEQTRREIAAYIAEGSITTEDGERILSAGKRAGLSIGKDGVHIA